jgi:hypothetical protein
MNDLLKETGSADRNKKTWLHHRHPIQKKSVPL